MIMAASRPVRQITSGSIPLGHVKIDIKSKSVKPNEGAFAKIESFFVGGGVVEKDGVYTTVADVQKKDDTVLYNRRGPYGCLFYNFPTKDDYEWFYNEVVVPDGQDTEGIYFQFAGSSASYMGIQRLAGNKGKVLFSVWSSYVTDDPNQIPADYTVTVLRKGENVTAQNFGGEGSGMQSWLDWDWKTEKTYKALVRIHPNGDNTTDFTGYFGDENGNWHLMAEFRRPKHDLWYKDPYAFVEVFDPKSGHITRSAYFTNTWGRTKDGQWHEVLNTQFHDGTNFTINSRMDRHGSVDGSRQYVKVCGFFDEDVIGDKWLDVTRASSQTKAPLTDEELAALP